MTALLLKVGIKAKIVPRVDPGFGKEKELFSKEFVLMILIC